MFAIAQLSCFYRTALYAGAVHAVRLVSVRLSVRLPQVDVRLKRLNVGVRAAANKAAKQLRGSSFLMPKSR